MASFEAAFVKTMKQETPWTQSGARVTFRPKIISDTGGVTKWGISSNAYPGTDIAAMSFEEAKKIYSSIWQSIKAGLIRKQESANTFFDHSFNAGKADAIGHAIKALKNMGSKIPENATIDYIISEINKYPTNFVKFFNAERAAHYESLIKSNPEKYKRYASGWAARLENFFNIKSALVGGALIALALIVLSKNKGR